MRILLTGGGTGGHLLPLVTVSRELKKIARENQIANLEIIYIGPDGFSKKILQTEGIKTKIILAAKLRRYISLQTILDFLKFPISIIQALWLLLVVMPDATLGKGGYGSFPAVLISRLYRIPVLIHESDAIPGLANRFLGRFAKRIAISFSMARKFFPVEKTALVGNPIRIELTQGSPEEAKRIFGLTGAKPVILIVGGSQGAQAINKSILLALPRLLEKYEIIWQVGKNNYDFVFKEIGETMKQISPNCHIFGFLDELQMTQAMASANLVISRAGAGGIFEIAACGKPSIIIPIPLSAYDHQMANALEYAQSGAAILLEQENLTPGLLLNEISRIIDNPELSQKMSDCAKAFAKPNAARQIAEELISLATAQSTAQS